MLLFLSRLCLSFFPPFNFKDRGQLAANPFL